MTKRQDQNTTARTSTMAAVGRQPSAPPAARVGRRGLDPATMAAPSTGALIARSARGVLLRLGNQTHPRRFAER